MKRILLLLAFIATAFVAQSQNVLGTWRTVDDETGETKSNVLLYEENGKIYGKVVALLRKGVDPNRVCDKCTDWRKGQKILQMMIVRDLAKSGDTWKGGKILDPEKGKEYTCTMWLEGGNLKVRGWIGPFFRTQTWYKVQ